MRHITLGIIMAFLFGLWTGNQAFAVARDRQPDRGLQTAEDILKMWERRIVQAETSRIMSVLGERIEDQAILAKARAKLRSLPAEEIRLVSSLCDRVSASERTARADIAFSLVTALIVLS